jgi:hypothetical protein
MENQSKKSQFFNLFVWTVIFTIVSFFFNKIIYKETVPQIIVLSYSLIGTIFLIGFIVSWIKFFASLFKKNIVKQIYERKN